MRLYMQEEGWSLSANYFYTMKKDILKVTDDLMVGSEGKEVETLQIFLQNEGYLDMPLEVKRGYFGSLTKASLARYQTALGIEASGFFGLLTRAVIRESMLHDHLGLRHSSSAPYSYQPA